MDAALFFEMLIGNPFNMCILGFPIIKWIKSLAHKITWEYSFSISIQVSNKKG